MKTLVLWSSRTGNTKAVAEAIYSALPEGREISEVGRVKDFSSYDVVFVGFWAYRRGADMLARKALSLLEGKKVAIYGTGGVYADSQTAKDYLENAAALLPESATLLGTFFSQGRVASFHEGKRSEKKEKVHPMTPERLERLMEAEKHPNEEDFARAKVWTKEVLDKASKE